MLASVCSFDLVPPYVLPSGTTTCISDSVLTTGESCNLELNMKENCETNVPYNMSEVIKSSYLNGTFWSTFSLVKSLANGHCIMNSIALCINQLHSIDCRVCLLLDVLMEECKKFYKYEDYYVQSEQTFYSEMRAYVYDKQYKSLFCEFVPAIMANALKHIIVVINVDAYAPDESINVYEHVPNGYENQNPICTKCGQKLGILVLLRRSDHYNACVQESNCSSPCSCDISTHGLVNNSGHK